MRDRFGFHGRPSAKGSASGRTPAGEVAQKIISYCPTRPVDFALVSRSGASYSQDRYNGKMALDFLRCVINFQLHTL